MQGWPVGSTRPALERSPTSSCAPMPTIAASSLLQYLLVEMALYLKRVRERVAPRSCTKRAQRDVNATRDVGAGRPTSQVLGVRRPRSMLVSTTFGWPTLRTAASPVLGEAPLPRRSHGRAAPSLGGPADLALVVAANATRAPPVSDRFESSDSARPDLVNRASHASPRPKTEGAARQGERGADGRSLTRRSISRRQTERLRAASTLSGCTRRVTCGSPGPRCKAAARRSMSRSPLV